jgi:glycosidase
MKVIIDIVPNHIARKYEGKTNPKGVKDFGADDDKTVEYKKDNNFYYIPNQPFKVPFDANYKPLGGEKNPLVDAKFDENPAKWTGNGSRLAQPNINDWYETVKINYGIKPDGSKDFDLLPAGYDKKDVKAHADFWKDKKVPSSWVKFRDICLYWTQKGVDGFRFDMTEMVPYEFWSYLNSAIKTKNPESFLLAEIYNPAAYRDYIKFGKMDYLYDKVELYDTLKNIMQGRGQTKNIAAIQNGLADIEHHMLHFLENHDEQRIASPEFAGNPRKALPAMVLSATISSSPTLIYFGQEVGEPGAQDAGFGKPSRTSIFDYIGVPHHQRWMNKGKFDGGQSTKEEKVLRDYYKRLLNFTIKSSALMGKYEDLHAHNLNNNETYDQGLYSFVRYNSKEKLIIINNFNEKTLAAVNLKIPKEIISKWQIKDGAYKLEEVLFNQAKTTLKISNGEGIITLALEPYQSFILKMP